MAQKLLCIMHMEGYLVYRYLPICITTFHSKNDLYSNETLIPQWYIVIFVHSDGFAGDINIQICKFWSKKL